MNPTEMNLTAVLKPIFSALLICFAFTLSGQISPGELVSPHAQLEGMLNCTKCHVLGDKVSNEKCLECHKEIKSLVDQDKGYHASSEVEGKECVSCHSDHHGKNFQIIRFDTEKFNHALTGYKLTGAHQKLDCNECHNNDKIDSYELKKKKYTYLGLKTECISCHQDVHQKTLSTDCASCHNTDKFAPATLFEHNKSDFVLKGKHKEVDCKKCHQITFINNAVFQKFADVPFKSCANCHEDVHNNQFGQNCKECHTEEGFNVFVGKSSFNHNQTDFPLLGKHAKVDCASCHHLSGNNAAANVFQDYRGKDFHDCITCHKDVHETKFGLDCKKCHTEDSFQKILHPDLFDHDLTGYALEGKHETVDCKKCHKTKMIDPVAHDRCMDCHEDFHKGQFVRDTHKPDCKDCHNINGFAGSSFTIEKHNEGPFPLEGAHLATPCIACHMKNEKWTFRDIGKKCVDCHSDIHEGFLDEKYYPQKSCNQCHSSEGWVQVSFDHLLTGFELQGKHQQALCVACHKPDTSTIGGSKRIPFTGLKPECISCHDDIHERQFEVAGATDCKRCHKFEAWKPSNFDHNTARFVLDGAHKNVTCVKCHKADVVEGKAVTKYKLEKFECVDCHK